MYSALLGSNGALLPDQILALLPPLRWFFAGVGNVPYLAGFDCDGKR